MMRKITAISIPYELQNDIYQPTSFTQFSLIIILAIFFKVILKKIFLSFFFFYMKKCLPPLTISIYALCLNSANKSQCQNNNKTKNRDFVI